jgi:hypothetical protein
VNLVGDLTNRGVGLKVLAGEGASIDTTTANGRLIFAIFAGLAEFERELIVERTKAGVASARARGRHGGRPFKMTPAKLVSPRRQWVSRKPRSATCAPNSASPDKHSIGSSIPQADYARTEQNSWSGGGTDLSVRFW